MKQTRRGHSVFFSIVVLVQQAVAFSNTQGVAYRNLSPSSYPEHPPFEPDIEVPINTTLEPSLKRQKILTEDHGFHWVSRFDCAPRVGHEQFDLRALPKAPKAKDDVFARNWMNQNAWLNGIVESEYQKYSQKHKSGVATMSPPVASLAVLLSKRLCSKLTREAYYLKRTYACGFVEKPPVNSRQKSQLGHKLTKSLGFRHEFFLPFAYRLILLKPSYNQLTNLETIFAKFCTQWKLLFVHENLGVEEISRHIKGLIKQKIATMFMWISEVLTSTCVPDFLEETLYSKKKACENKQPFIETDLGSRHGGARIHPIAHLFCLPAVMTLSKRGRLKTEEKLFGALMDRWKIDYDNGYPWRKTISLAQRELHDSAGENSPTTKMEVWNTWCASIFKIIKTAKVFDSLIFKKVTLEEPNSKEEYEFLIQMISQLPAAKTLASKQVLSDTWCNFFQIKEKQKMYTMLETIPTVLMKPMGNSDSLEKLTYFLNLKDKMFSLQYLPDKLATFFNLDLVLGEDGLVEYDQEFQNHKKFHQMNAERVRKHFYSTKRKNNLAMT